MIELIGKHNTAKVFTDMVDNETTGEVINLLNQEFTKDSKIRIMPDCHKGAGCTIGTTMTLKDKAVANLVGVDIGCTDKDTEVLTPNGWIKISEYNNENILIYDKTTDTAFFDKPHVYIKAPCDTFYHFHSDKNLDQMLSEDHRMLLWRGYKGRGYTQEVKLAKEVFNEHNKNTKSNRAIKTTFNFNNTPLPISEDMIRIITMVSADGHIRTSAKQEQYITLHFRKQRKIQRAKTLLSNANIPFKESIIQDGSTNIYFRPPITIDKTLTQFFNASKEQLKIITDEIYHWDGTIDNKRNHKHFASTNKANADLIQFAHATNGIRAGISTPNNPTDKEWNQTYNVYETKNQYVGFPNYQLKTVKSRDGYKYCFTTSTGFFIIRRNNCISITGNCFTGDTLVWCSAGHYDRIKDLAEMSTPFMTDSFDEEQQGFVESKAIAKLTRHNAELVAVTYTTHRIIEERNITTRVRCTPDHKYLVCTEHTGPMPNYKDKKCIWVEAKDLQPGMQLVSDCNYITVTEVEPLKDREDVYCLTVENTHNFPIEGGVIVHNCGMLTVKLTEKEPEIDLSKLDTVIRQHVPSGFNVHSKQRHATPLDCTKLACWQQKGAGINDTLAYRSVGTLGGGEEIASGKVKSLT